jgi:hypothetical protein
MVASPVLCVFSIALSPLGLKETIHFLSGVVVRRADAQKTSVFFHVQALGQV